MLTNTFIRLTAFFFLFQGGVHATSQLSEVKIDSYGQHWVHATPHNNVSHKIDVLKSLLSSFLAANDKTAFFVTVPHTKLEQKLQQEGFELYATTSTHREWIYKNNSPIAPALSGSAGAVGYIIHNGHILLIEDKGRPGALECPGGGMEVGEYSDKAVLREVREEVGLDVEIVQLIGNTQRVFEKRYGVVNNHGYFYLLKIKDSTNITPAIDPKEILQAKWISLKDIDHHKLSSITRLILNHLKGKSASNNDPNRLVYLHELSKKSRLFLARQGVEMQERRLDAD